MITTNYESSHELIPEGNYEVIIGQPTSATTRGGTTYIDIPLTVREDLAQQSAGAVIHHSIWKKHSPNDMDNQIGGYNFGAVMAVMKNAGIPSGQSFDSLKSMLSAIVGKPIRISLIHEEYNGFKNERVSSFSPTAHPVVNTVVTDDVPF